MLFVQWIVVVVVLDIQKGGRARELINRDDEVPTEEDEEEEITPIK